MKIGIRRICKKFLAYYNLLIFFTCKTVFGFDVANLRVSRIDKSSLLMILKRNGAIIGSNCDIETGLVFHNCSDYSNLKVGCNSHIGKNCFFDLRDKVIIGDNVVVSMQTTFITHIDLNRTPLSLIYQKSSSPITINEGVYIGANSTILKGVILENDCFIAAGSLVNITVKSYTMAGGIPAKIIKKIDH